MSGRQWAYPQGKPVGLQINEQVNRELKGQLPADAFGIRVYDTWRVKAGAAVPTNDFYFFQNPVGTSQSVLNAAGESYIKNLQDTNVFASGMQEQGQVLLINSMQVQVVIPSQTDTTYPTSGPATELASNPAAAAAVSGVNLMTAVLDQTFFVFKVSEAEYESGPGWMFPSEYGISGFAGFGSATDFEGASNNGFGRKWEFPVQRMIPALTTYSVKCNFLQATTMTRNFVVRVILEGIKFRRVQ